MLNTATLFGFLSSLVFFAAVTQADTDDASNKSKLCSLNLQEVLSQPQTYSSGYMKTVADNFRSGSALLFTPNAQNYIAEFENRWGVKVRVFNPTDLCSNDYQEECVTDPLTIYQPASTFESNVTLYSLYKGNPYTVKSMSITLFNGVYDDSRYISNPFINATLGIDVNFDGSVITPQITLISPSACQAQQTFNLTFSDQGSATIGSGSTCSQLNDNPPADFAPVNPFSTFKGYPVDSNWALSLYNPTASPVSFYGWTLQICYDVPISGTCSSDVARSFLNQPGFRYDPGTQKVYWTEDIFDCTGQMRQVTISRSVTDMFIKK